MTGNAEATQSQRAESITELEVSDGGTLRMANYSEPKTRAEYYDSVTSLWSRSPIDMAEAMEECQPLAWAVYRIYSDVRKELEDARQDAQDGGGDHKRTLASLTARLAALPYEPEEGAADWLAGLTSEEFEVRVMPVIRKWFSEAPKWAFEGDYLPVSSTAQGAAVEFLSDMSAHDLRTLGVVVVDGEHPGSTYYAAELRGSIENANRSAEAAGFQVRFVPAIV